MSPSCPHAVHGRHGLRKNTLVAYCADHGPSYLGKGHVYEAASYVHPHAYMHPPCSWPGLTHAQARTRTGLHLHRPAYIHSSHKQASCTHKPACTHRPAYTQAPCMCRRACACRCRGAWRADAELTVRRPSGSAHGAAGTGRNQNVCAFGGSDHSW